MRTPYLPLPVEVFSASRTTSSLFQEKVCRRAAGASSWIVGRIPNTQHLTGVNPGTSISPKTLSLQTWGPFRGACSPCCTVTHSAERARDSRAWPLPERTLRAICPRRKWDNGGPAPPLLHTEVLLQRDACSLHLLWDLGPTSWCLKVTRKNILEKAKMFPTLTFGENSSHWNHWF